MKEGECFCHYCHRGPCKESNCKCDCHKKKTLKTGDKK